MSIPRIIWTAWLSEKGVMPPLIERCIASQQIGGYEHRVITLDHLQTRKEMFGIEPYLQQALDAKKWVKAVDWLRMETLYYQGGIFLDADVEILQGKNFDLLLDASIFAAREKNGFIGAAVLGAEPWQKFIRLWMDEVVANFRGDDDKNFESSMDILVRGYFEKGWPKEGWTMVDTEVFYPYDHQYNTTNIREDTICYHHFFKSWVPKPKISIIIPQLGREDGLQKLLASIVALNYPKECIQLVIKRGQGTVPVKVSEALQECEGEYIAFMANDTEFTPDTLDKALEASIRERKALVAFNTGPLYPDEGNICEHFLIRRNFIEKIGGEIFCTKMHHVGVDNLLWAKASKLNEAYRAEDAIIHHNHYSKTGRIDDVYIEGWKNVYEDRKILAEELAKL